MSYELVDEHGGGADLATSGGLQELRDAEIPQRLADFLDRGTLTPEEASALIVELTGGEWDYIADALDNLQGNVVLSNGIVEDDGADYADWNEAEHPRHEAGSPQGGEFAPAGGSEKPLQVYLTPNDVEPYDTSGGWGGTVKEDAFKIKGGAGFYKGKILSRDQLPETIYHVTTAKDVVEKTGYLLGQTDGGGMGGGNGLAGVSLTTSKDTAEFIARELKRSATLAQTVRSRADYSALLDKYVAEDYKIGGSTPDVGIELAKAKGYALDNFDANIDQYIKYRKEEPGRFTGNAYAVLAAETYSSGYLNMRGSIAYKDFDNRNTHPLRNPLLMGGNDARAKLDPNQVAIIPIKRESIPATALVRTGSDDFL